MEKRKYNREFKINAVKLCQESSKNTAEIANDLGIPKSTLVSWMQQFKEEGGNSFRGSGKIKHSNEDVYNLRRELADVKMERDILKKAMAIFSRPKG